MSGINGSLKKTKKEENLTHKFSRAKKTLINAILSHSNFFPADKYQNRFSFAPESVSGALNGMLAFWARAFFAATFKIPYYAYFSAKYWQRIKPSFKICFQDLVLFCGNQIFSYEFCFDILHFPYFVYSSIPMLRLCNLMHIAF